MIHTLKKFRYLDNFFEETTILTIDIYKVINKNFISICMFHLIIN